MLFPAVRHEVSFWHGADRLIGDLVLPATPGPHPVLLVVGGSAAAGRDRSPWLDALARAGVASFSWERLRPHRATSVVADGADRPHAPSGDLFDDPSDDAACDATPARAREVLAAIERLGCLPEVDPTAIGLLGWGAGGWAAAQAATFGGRVRVLVLASTPMVPGSSRGGEAFDPRPTLSGVTVPVLAMFGEQDPLLPLEQSVRGVRLALRSAGHLDHEIAVIRGADHALRVRPAHGLGRMRQGLHQFGDWPAGLTEFVLSWLEGRLHLATPVPGFAPPAVATSAAAPPAAGTSAVGSSAVGSPPVGSTDPALPGPRGTAAATSRPGPGPGHGVVPVRQVRRRITR